MYMLKCVCAVCGIQYATKECIYNPGDYDKTHGLCDKHLAEAHAEIDKKIKKLEKGKDKEE